MDAFVRGSAVLTPDLLSTELQDHWTVFADAALVAGARAVFSLPLQKGAIRAGVLDLYADIPTVLNTEELADAMADRSFEDLGAYRAEIDQAGGMLTAQLGVGIEEAFVRLRAYALAQGRRLADVAADVVARRLRFSPDGEPDQDEEET
ncbi:ANTAR domain-containing protein [Streptomyces sp. DG2A-72]|uniref:GAF and ANTAR domain-containing protein n=1 Tax=Streptomyces sp. DG2A-72 TaxID=3051386 RepID=UPI00265C8B2A|nr:ANTAR domain-containing protein [Streptomyces sp. DG2A-72]MDO0933247.1 ANTAR domain-containing protein [Streptomyces sp. DG2A-72]